MSWDTTIEVTDLGCLHRCWGASKVLEHGRIIVLIYDAVPLEYDPALKLPGWVILGEFRVFLDADAKEVSHVHVETFALSLISNVIPFACV